MAEDTVTKPRLPAEYTRPSLVAWLKAGYGKDLEGSAKMEAYIAFFESHEGELAEEYAAGELSDEVLERMAAKSEADSQPASTTEPREDGLPHHLHVVSQVRRVGTRTARATSPTRHRFKQYLFGNPSLRLIRKGKVAVPTDQIIANIAELIDKEKQGLLSVHMADGRKIDLSALYDGAGMDAVGAGRPDAPPPNPPLDSIANDDPSGNPMQTYIEGTFPGDPAAERALQGMVAEKLNEQGNTEVDTAQKDTSAAGDGQGSVQEETKPPEDAAKEDTESDVTESTEEEFVDPAAEVSTTEPVQTHETQTETPETKAKGKGKGKHR